MASDLRLIDFPSSALAAGGVTECPGWLATAAFLDRPVAAGALADGLVTAAGRAAGVAFFAGAAFAAIGAGFTGDVLAAGTLAPAFWPAAAGFATVFLVAACVATVALVSAAGLGAVFLVTMVLSSAMSLARLMDSGVAFGVKCSDSVGHATF
ncbi:membrane hypothetical protein [Thiocapsa sp. KS1]|nr:membrane hypothetical protein [Thiocapsa sp. KS1]